MEDVARVVLALERPEVAEEVMHFLDRSGRSRVVGTAADSRQLAEAVRQLEPDAIVATPALLPSRSELNGSALLALDTTQSVSSLRRALRAGAAGFYLWPAEREDLANAAARPRSMLEHVAYPSAPKPSSRSPGRRASLDGRSSTRNSGPATTPRRSAASPRSTTHRGADHAAGEEDAEEEDHHRRKA